MNVTIELSDEKAAAFQSQAAALGVTLEHWLADLLGGQYVQSGPTAYLRVTNPEEWGRRFRAWADGLQLDTPVLSDEAMSREGIYSDRS